jgi:pteridine reductase
VTGGAKRLGAEIVRALHGAGASVVIHCNRSATAANDLSSELNGLRPGSAAVCRADLRNISALQSLVDAVLHAFGRLDILVNNASTFYPTPVGSITAEAFDDLIGTNLKAPLFLAQSATAELRRSRGLIVNLVDIHGAQPLKQHPVYSSAKAGLAMLTKSLARELGPEIRVNGVAPGPVMWPEGSMDPKLQTQILERTALKRIGSPGDVAKAVLFFAKDAPYVTGQILAVDGGRSAGGY